MSGVLGAAALLVTGFGLLGAAAVLARSRDGRLALRVLLEFLTAAGLLRLAGNPGWAQIGSVAAVVALRQLLSLGLRG